MNPEESVRAVVMLNTGDIMKSSSRREARENRRALLTKLRKNADDALIEIDETLREHRGRRLADQVSALGTIPVETTPDGIAALARSDNVRAIFEDQPISLSGYLSG
jgi:hypothetical protein